MPALRDFVLVRGHTLLASALRPGGATIDAGAHRLEFARTLADRFDQRVVALEPNAALVSRETYHPGVEIRAAALGPASGAARFFLDANPEASSLFSRPSAAGEGIDVSVLSLDEVMDTGGEVDLLKLDVEGAEFALLDAAPAATLQRIGQISVEFHDFLPGWTRDDTARAWARLESLGFVGLKASLRGAGDVIFLNRRRVDVGAGAEAWLRLALPVRRKRLARTAATTGSARAGRRVLENLPWTD